MRGFDMRKEDSEKNKIDQAMSFQVQKTQGMFFRGRGNYFRGQGRSSKK